MATPRMAVSSVEQEALVNYVISMARTVALSAEKSVQALLLREERLASEVFLMEPRVNEMEILLDDHGVRLLSSALSPAEIRMVIATLKIANDLERIGDLAVNISERVISLRTTPGAEPPADLEPMAQSVLAMLRQALGALQFQNAELAVRVLEADDIVDRYRDNIFEHLLETMTENPATVSHNFQFLLATRFLERIADHSTNIAEDVIFWVRGLDVRHGRGRSLSRSGESSYPTL